MNNFILKKGEKIKLVSNINFNGDFQFESGEPPKRDNIYLINDIKICANVGVCVTLMGNSVYSNDIEVTFPLTGFVPVVPMSERIF